MKTIISPEDCRETLLRIKEYLPSSAADEMTCDFASYLAQHLKDPLSPEGFATFCKSALYDLKIGKNLVTDKPIEHRLVGKIDGSAFWKDAIIQTIVEIVFSEEPVEMR